MESEKYSLTIFPKESAPCKVSRYGACGSMWRTSLVVVPVVCLLPFPCLLIHNKKRLREQAFLLLISPKSAKQSHQRRI